jgi:23S rRNA (cytosine1962-C5)-methyltransferase
MESVAITPKGVARVRAGSSWLWRPEIAQAPAGLPAGSVAVRGPRGERMGAALWSPRSPVALRMYDLDPDAGDLTLDRLGARIARSAARRVQMYGEGVDAYRVVHADADDVPGLLVDRYGDLLTVQIACEAIEVWQADLPERIARSAGCAVRAVVVRDDGSTRDFEGLPRRAPRLAVGAQATARYHEGRVAYEIDALSDAKTGAFLDQRENHLSARQYGRGAARVLDAFAYHGGFGLQLLDGGAEHALLLEQNPDAATRAREHAERAGFAGRCEVRTADAFTELGRLEAAGERFDVVVIDPPALAKRHGSAQAAERPYRDLNLRALRLLGPEGVLVTCSCSGRVTPEQFGRILDEAAGAARRPLQILEKRGAGRDHPERAGIPETAYLKCWFARAL